MSVEQQDSNLDLQQLLGVLRASQEGDFAPRMNEGGSGLEAEIAATVNALQRQHQLFANEVERIVHEIGAGVLGGQAEVADVAGQWQSVVDSLNVVGGQLCLQVRAISRVFDAANRGAQSGEVTMPGEGEYALLRDILNTHLAHDHTPQA